MTRDDIQRRFEALMGDEISPDERKRTEAELAEIPAGSKLLEAYRWFQQPLAADSSAGLVEAIVERLPRETPQTFAAVAELTMSAWSDPTLAAALREDPRSTLQERGIDVDAGTRIEIVTPEAAPLPSKGVLAIPLPEPGSAARSQAEARLALKRTDFGWLLDSGSFDPMRSESRADRKRPRTNRSEQASARRARWRWSLALTGALAVIAVAVFGRGTVPGDLPLWGTAGDAGNEAWLTEPLFGVALVVAVVAIWYAFTRSR